MVKGGRDVDVILYFVLPSSKFKDPFGFKTRVLGFTSFIHTLKVQERWKILTITTKERIGGKNIFFGITQKVEKKKKLF